MAHTPTPRKARIKACDHGISVGEGERAVRIAHFLFSEDAEAAVCAVNAFEPMREALEAVLEYFESREDADHNGISFVVNEEMRLAIDIREALKIAKEGTE